MSAVGARLAGKAVLVTGGASGIGLATARRLVAEGALVHLVDLDADGLERATTALGASAGSSVADVTDETAVARAVAAAAARRGGTLDAVFANAGIPGKVAPVAEYPREEFARVLEVHVLGAFLVAKHAVPLLTEAGSIVVCSSTVGLRAAPNSAAYSTAKHALVGFARSLARELAPRRIRVNTIHPGPTDTAFQHGIEMAATGLDEAAAAAAFDARIPLGRHAAPEEIAGLVAYLVSDESRFITSATLAIDGGMSG